MVVAAHGIDAFDAWGGLVSRIVLLRLMVIIGVIAVIELLCDMGVISPMVMIPPSAMLVTLVHIILSGEADADLVFTLTNIAAAVTLSVVVGFILGAVIHALPRLRRVTDPLLAAYYAVPTFVFYPLLIVVFGMNRLPLIVIGAMFGVVGMAVSTIDGIDRIPRVLTKTAHSYRMNPVATALMIKLPAAAPHLFTGVKLGDHLFRDRGGGGRIHPVDRRPGPPHRLRL